MYDLPDFLSIWKRVQNYVTAGLLLTAVVAGGMYYVTNLRLEACEANTQAIVESTRAAAAEAEVAAINDRNRIEEEYREHAAEQAQAYDDLLGRYNASLVRYANRGQASRPAPAPEGGSTGSADGPSSSTDVPDDLTVTSDLILITFSDAEICAENTARLEVAREWALGLEEIE